MVLITCKNTGRSIGITIDPSQNSITFNDRQVFFGFTEFLILSQLLNSFDHCVTREELFKLNRTEDDDSDSRVIDSHVSHIRQKLFLLQIEDLQISSVYGKGYRIHFCSYLREATPRKITE